MVGIRTESGSQGAFRTAKDALNESRYVRGACVTLNEIETETESSLSLWCCGIEENSRLLSLHDIGEYARIG